MGAFGSARKTDAGEPVSIESAAGLSAVHCATRVITEGLAMIPFSLREHIDDRNTRAAYGHRLYRLVHDRPNPDQNRFTFFDTAAPQQINGGGSFNYTPRSNGLPNGEVLSITPIHHTRVKIKRGPVKGDDGHVYGINGTLVYCVQANDGSHYGVEQWEMLHVPGIMSPDGLNGLGLVWIAAQSLGAIQATEKHVSSFFKNGASSDLVISIKSPVPKDEQQNLRTSFQQKYAGAENAHKAILLFGDTEVDQVGIDPQKMMLIDMRKFGIAEVSRFWRVPMHMLSELGRATWANIEDQGQDFITYCFGPWVSRWEMAMNTQLLTDEEQKRYFFKANLNALLRGNSAARMAYFNSRFDRGNISINEIREYEDENPIPGGDRYFLQGNNYVPLDRIDEVATIATQPAGKTSEPEDDSAEDARKQAAEGVRKVLAATIKGLMEYEARFALQKAEKHDFLKSLADFYDGRFGETFESQVSPIVQSALSLGCVGYGPTIRHEHNRDSYRAIAKCHSEHLDKTMPEFVAALKSLFDNWTHRAEDEANAAFGITKE